MRACAYAQGYNDVGFHGSEIKTPFLDSLNHAGVELRNYYGHMMCAARRRVPHCRRRPWLRRHRCHLLSPDQDRWQQRLLLTQNARCRADARLREAASCLADTLSTPGCSTASGEQARTAGFRSGSRRWPTTSKHSATRLPRSASGKQFDSTAGCASLPT
jgi:hypothetical protein